MSDKEQPKIIIDDDWKSSAQAEKEKLVQAEHDAAQAAAEGKTPGLPEQIGFKEVISMLATQALMYMGAFPDESGRAMVSLDVAKMNIDMLGVIQEKTKGNLSEEEKKMLDGTITELRYQFVEVTKAVSKAAADGTLEQMQQPAPGAPDLGANPGGPSLKF
ncbi:MAG: DUF1844 domain-containing protein [Phycisphaerales bacterium]|nr:DUF1844 domain-containing protein [Phycisphaerales bacterium]